MRGERKSMKIFANTKGVIWVWQRQKWCARVSRRGVRFFLGYFTLYKEAYDAVKAFKDRHATQSR